MSDTRFFGYKHWTLEDPPRCFNVGKGLKGRAESCSSRNHKWHAICKHLGLRVEICVGPMMNEEAKAWEIANVKLMDTFSTNHSHDDFDDIGCNLTAGGDLDTTGVRLRPETKTKLSIALSGRKLSDSTRENMRNAEHSARFKQGNLVWLGRHHTDESRMKNSASNVGKHDITEVTRQKLVQSHLGKKQSDATRQKRSASLRAHAERRKQLKVQMLEFDEQ